MNKTVLAQELVLTYESWKVLQEIVLLSFCHPHRNPTETFCSRTSYHSSVVSHMKIANVHIGNLHRNVRIALQFLHQFAILISVCNSHVSLQFSRFGVFPTWMFAIFIWVCNFHMSLHVSYQIAILTLCHQTPALLMWLRMGYMSL